MTNGNPLQPIDVKAPTLEQAIDEGLTQLGLTRDDVIIEIVEEGSRGVLGMGARDAIVRLTPLRLPQPPVAAPTRPAPPPPPPPVEETPVEPEPVVFGPDEPAEPVVEPPAAPPLPPEPREPVKAPPAPVDEASMEEEASVSTETLRELLAQMDVRATVETYRAEQESDSEIPPWILDIRGSDLGILIGRRGETLNALQYLTRLIVSRELQRRANIVVDVEGYKSRREAALRKLAHRMAQQAKQMGRTVTLEPMPPNERRIIHITLRGDKNVSTESIGMGDQRKVTIIPNR